MRHFRVSILVLVLGLVSVCHQAECADPLAPIDKLIQLERYHEALPLIEAEIESDPNNPIAHHLFSKINLNLSRFKACKENLARCAALDPEGSKQFVGMMRSRLAYWEGDPGKAREYLEQAGDFEPANSSFPLLLDTKGMQRTRTQHFQIYVEDALAAAGALDAAAKVLERLHKEYSKIFAVKSDPICSPVYLFATWESFAQHQRRIIGEEPARDRVGNYLRPYRAMALHCGTKRHPVLSGGLTEPAIRSIYHQGFQQFAHMYSPGLPQWLESGCAAYASESVFKKGRPELGTFRKKDADRDSQYHVLKAALNDNALFPLSTLLTLRAKDFNDDAGRRRTINEAHAWALIHYLLHSKKKRKGKKLLREFFIGMRKGLSQNQAFARTFGKQDLTKMNALLLAYIKKMCTSS